MIVVINANSVHIPLRSKSVHCIVTSPPYWGLRDYGTATWEGGDPECDHIKPRGGNGKASAKQVTSAGTQNYQYPDVCGKCGAQRIDAQLGQERIHDCLGWVTGKPCGKCFVCHMVQVARECWRVLRDDGTFWLNLGDSYSGSGGPSSQYDNKAAKSFKGEFKKYENPNKKVDGLKPKDLCGIPWRVAFALQADGWYLRRDNIWFKDNPMPESAVDRTTTTHEYLFHLSKSQKYYYDAVAIEEPTVGTEYDKTKRRNGRMQGTRYLTEGKGQTVVGASLGCGSETRNKRSVWQISTLSYSGAHFATYPPLLVEPCVKAGTSEKGCCPECGSPWERIFEHHLVPTVKAVKTSVVDERDWNADSNDQGSNRQKDGHMPGYASSNITLGWRPGCDCYGLEIIGNPPSRPKNPKSDNGANDGTNNKEPYTGNNPHLNRLPDKLDDEYSQELQEWECEMAAWREKWNTLKPLYDECRVVPAIVFDPFSGSGTTVMVARNLGRDGIGLDLSLKYIRECSMERLGVTDLKEWTEGIKVEKSDLSDLPMFAEMA